MIRMEKYYKERITVLLKELVDTDELAFIYVLIKTFLEKPSEEA